MSQEITQEMLENARLIDLPNGELPNNMLGVAVLARLDGGDGITFEKIMCGTDAEGRYLTRDGIRRIYLNGMRGVQRGEEAQSVLVFGARPLATNENYAGFNQLPGHADMTIGNAMKETADKLHDAGLTDFAKAFALMFTKQPWNEWAFN